MGLAKFGEADPTRHVAIDGVLGLATLLLGLASIVLVFGFTSDRMYGVSNPVNLVAYWHISLAWTSCLALLATFLGSVLFLWTRERVWNLVAHSAGEVGFLFLTGALVTGSTWGSVIWNVWWSWSDIRLVTLFIAWIVYAGYLVVFSATRDGAGRFAATYGVVGFVTIPLSFVSTRIWNPQLHNPTLGSTSSGTVIEPLTLVVSILAVTCLGVYLFTARFRLHRVRDELLGAMGGR